MTKLKISYMDDLHLEFADIELPGGDILVLAGDIMTAEPFGNNGYQGRELAQRFRRFLTVECAKYRRVLYVLGNHEHYHNIYQATVPMINRELPANVTLLADEAVEIDGVYFWGGTVWADCNKADPLTMQQLKAGMNDFKVIKIDSKEGHKALGYYVSKFTPEFMLTEHRQSVAALTKFLAEHKDDTVVVISHHAPTFKSVAPWYQHDTLMNGGYASSLENIMLDNTNIRYWFHGHMHDAVDYTVGSTHVLSNPRGYVGYETSAQNFDATKYVEIEVDGENSNAT